MLGLDPLLVLLMFLTIGIKLAVHSALVQLLLVLALVLPWGQVWVNVGTLLGVHRKVGHKGRRLQLRVL